MSGILDEATLRNVPLYPLQAMRSVDMPDVVSLKLGGAFGTFATSS